MAKRKKKVKEKPAYQVPQPILSPGTPIQQDRSRIYNVDIIIKYVIPAAAVYFILVIVYFVYSSLTKPQKPAAFPADTASIPPEEPPEEEEEE